MKKLIAKEKRVNELLKFGAPKPLLENIGNIEELKFRVEKVNNAYFYLPKIANYSILEGLNIIPIYCCGNYFYVFAHNYHVEKIIGFELETDQVYIDYNKNWNLLLMDIMIDFYDDNIDDGLELEKFNNVGEKIGFNKVNDLFKLRDLPINEYNLKFKENEKWRIELAHQLKII